MYIPIWYKIHIGFMDSGIENIFLYSVFLYGSGSQMGGNLVLFRGGMAAFVIFYFSAYLCIVYINSVFHVIVFNN